MPDAATTTDILNGNLSNILNFLSAAAGLGTAAMGLVDATKAFFGGPSNFGFGYIEKAVEPFLVKAAGTPAAFGKAEILQTLKANWLNGVAKTDQKAKAKSLIQITAYDMLWLRLISLGSVVAAQKESVAEAIRRFGALWITEDKVTFKLRSIDHRESQLSMVRRFDHVRAIGIAARPLADLAN